MFDLEEAAYTEDARMMLESALEENINTTGLETSGHHLADESIEIILGQSVSPGGWSQITYKTPHKGWSVIWCYLLDA